MVGHIFVDVEQEAMENVFDQSPQEQPQQPVSCRLGRGGEVHEANDRTVHDWR